MNRRVLLFLLGVGGALAFACSGGAPRDEGALDLAEDERPRVEALEVAPGERLVQLIQDERVYLETREAATEDEQSAIGFYRNHLGMLALGVEMSTNIEWDLCRLGIPLERQAIVASRADPRLAGSPLWDRYSALLDDLEALLCREYDELTLVGDRYIGQLGDFRVNQGSVFDGGRPCSASFGEFGPFPSDHHQSELWLDAFSSSALPNFCADDDRLTAVFEYAERGILKRGYFYQAPLAVGFNALREPPQLLEVEGHPAIVGRDAPSSKQVYLYAIERFPDGDTPGIYVFVLTGDSDIALARETAAELLP